MVKCRLYHDTLKGRNPCSMSFLGEYSPSTTKSCGVLTVRQLSSAKTAAQGSEASAQLAGGAAGAGGVARAIEVQLVAPFLPGHES
jgi:hypothetical protein